MDWCDAQRAPSLRNQVSGCGAQPPDGAHLHRPPSIHSRLTTRIGSATWPQDVGRSASVPAVAAGRAARPKRSSARMSADCCSMREPRGRGPDQALISAPPWAAEMADSRPGGLPGDSVAQRLREPPSGPNRGPTLVPFLFLGTRGAVRSCSVTRPTKPTKRLQSACLLGSVRTYPRGCEPRPQTP
jgi:hypothetical protein